MGSIIKQVPLKSKQKKIESKNARRLAQLRNLELETRREIEQLTAQLSKEEINLVESTFTEKEEATDDVPKYLSVAEVSGIMGISPQMVRRNCTTGKYQGYQPSGPHGIWFINSDTFRNGSKQEWLDFISRRNNLFSRSEKVAKVALELQNNE